MHRERASVGHERGSFFLSILPCRIVSFSAMEKERRKKEKMLNFTDYK
jgi:hypothetical protein